MSNESKRNVSQNRASTIGNFGDSIGIFENSGYEPDNQTSGLKAGKRIVGTVNGVEYAFRWCPAGKFMMGSPESNFKKAFSGEPGRLRDEKQHRVTLTQGFWIQETEVTQAMWKSVMGTTIQEQARQMLQDATKYKIGSWEGTLRDYYGQKKKDETSKDETSKDMLHGVGPNYPVYYVSWDECQKFCQKLCSLGLNVRLPTEAQWEYACRAGTTDATYEGEMKIMGLCNAPILDPIAWYSGNSSQDFNMKSRWNSKCWPETQYPGGPCGAHEVGTKKANAWGLYDMIGNVWEWCQDWYGDYPEDHGDCPEDPVIDPTGPVSGMYRVCRGGSWNSHAKYCRSASRNCDIPETRYSRLGFRLILSPPSEGEK